MLLAPDVAGMRGQSVQCLGDSIYERQLADACIGRDKQTAMQLPKCSRMTTGQRDVAGMRGRGHVGVADYHSWLALNVAGQTIICAPTAAFPRLDSGVSCLSDGMTLAWMLRLFSAPFVAIAESGNMGVGEQTWGCGGVVACCLSPAQYCQALAQMLSLRERAGCCGVVLVRSTSRPSGSLHRPCKYPYCTTHKREGKKKKEGKQASRTQGQSPDAALIVRGTHPTYSDIPCLACDPNHL
ncbi:hypothetical protein DM02DRAFT_178029 [Periconia macrospinosa]|uniref:Uncharacterized protein n=1 Tax=Periconia macrospinosa TaxID=97972 RepID=A0A2V1E2C6_9PLEO|nr:hypothetical protein DM02DRAFT_178029 [Periconia macrospinosa]